MREWVLKYEGPVLHHNKLTSLHHHARAKIVKEIRTTAFYLAREACIPELVKAAVVFQPYITGRGRPPDCCGMSPTAKAVIDGALVDSGCLPDDGPRFLKFVGFRAPIVAKKKYVDVIIVELLGDD